MIMCVKKDSLKVSNYIQKDVDLSAIVDGAIYFDSLDLAYNEGYVPLDFSVSIRSTYTNLVAEICKDNENKKYFANLTNIGNYNHKGFDLIMYIASICVTKFVNFNNKESGFGKVMLDYSDFVPMGLLNINPDFINPIIYSHVIIDDNGVEEFSKYFENGVKWVSIDSIEGKEKGFAMLDSFIMLK